MRQAQIQQQEPRPAATVFVVDDEDTICQALSSLFRSVGLQVQTFPSAAEFLAAQRPDLPSCLLLDIRLPGLSGLELQRKLVESGNPLPVIVMTGYGDIPMSVRAFKAGAVDFFTKPFRDQDLLEAVDRAIQKDWCRRERESAAARLRTRYGSLTEREKEIFGLVTDGLMNKQTAAVVGLSEITVKIHRGRVMRKMGARTLPDLVRMAQALKAGGGASHSS